MAARQPLAAGAIVVSLATVVLLGWTFDITAAKSVLDGWRVMVPATALSFVLIGIALVFAADHRDGRSGNVLAARAFALIAVIVPAVSFIEYLTGLRTGVESWIGFRFDAASDVAGRISPLGCL